MTFWGEERWTQSHAEEEHGHDAHADHAEDDHDDEHHALPPNFKPHESPWVMTVPLIVLAFLSTVGGLVGVPYAMSSLVGIKDANAFEHVLEPVVAEVETPAAVKARENAKAHSPEAVSTERWLALLSTVFAVFGIAVGFLLFRNNPLRKMPKILEEKWRLDEFYNGYIVDPLTDLSRKRLWQGFDLGFIDGIVNGIGNFVMAFGNIVRGVQVGYVRTYAAFVLLGALAVIGYFIYFGFKLL
jgi:NADH-quinone oxidoreductase subunit L